MLAVVLGVCSGDCRELMNFDLGVFAWGMGPGFSAGICPGWNTGAAEVAVAILSTNDVLTWLNEWIRQYGTVAIVTIVLFEDCEQRLLLCCCVLKGLIAWVERSI